jgi:hypothetical protein
MFSSLGKEASILLKKLAAWFAAKWEKPYFQHIPKFFVDVTLPNNATVREGIDCKIERDGRETDEGPTEQEIRRRTDQSQGKMSEKAKDKKSMKPAAVLVTALLHLLQHKNKN